MSLDREVDAYLLRVVVDGERLAAKLPAAARPSLRTLCWLASDVLRSYNQSVSAAEQEQALADVLRHMTLDQLRDVAMEGTAASAAAHRQLGSMPMGPDDDLIVREVVDGE